VETVLHSFGENRDGKNPYAGLINVNGTLYGTTLSGGAKKYGSVFAVTMSAAEKVLHRFRGGSDGRKPHAGLTNVEGKLYGTTFEGGASNVGVVFSISPSKRLR
jgi:uncharacterized repeat protein (TIGR03803 family)